MWIRNYKGVMEYINYTDDDYTYYLRICNNISINNNFKKNNTMQDIKNLIIIYG